jgi:hypothetical protein
MNLLKRIPLELLFWMGALVLLGLSEPLAQYEQHFSLCPLAAIGLDWCPGCGIGRSITQLFHGNIDASFQHHWFGIPALLILVHRVVVLAVHEIKSFKIKYKEDRYV